MNRHLRDLQRGLDEIRETSPGAVHVVAECQRALDALKPRKAPAKVLRGPSRAQSREARRVEKERHTESVRFEVFKRDGGRCVVCGDPATDMHHLVYGSGLRRVAETGKTCAAVCRAHHDMAHAGSDSILLALRAWAAPRGYSLAADALARRLAKISARRAAGQGGERG